MQEAASHQINQSTVLLFLVLPSDHKRLSHATLLSGEYFVSLYRTQHETRLPQR